MTAPLPGMEDIDAPAGLTGWAFAEWKLRRSPGRLIVLRALARLADARGQTLACNATILRSLAGEHAIKPRTLEVHIGRLETVDKLIRRDHSREAKSRRRITFTFDVSAQSDTRKGGAIKLRPWAQPSCAPSCRWYLTGKGLRKRPRPL